MYWTTPRSTEPGEIWVLVRGGKWPDVHDETFEDYEEEGTCHRLWACEGSFEDKDTREE